MRCAVLKCNKNNKVKNCKMHAFKFPKCKKLRSQWIKFCRRKDFNVETSVICDAHFKKEDFSNNMQFEMGFTKFRFLNDTACPSIYKEEETTISSCRRNERMQVREQRQVVYRIRSYILGRNEGVLSNEANVQVDDTPDLEGVTMPLTGCILKSTTNNVEIPVVEKYDDLEYDGLENLAGYVCHRLRHETPEIAEKNKLKNFTWANQLDEGNLSKPTTEMMNVMKQLRAVFEEFNGEKLLISENYLKNLVTASCNIMCNKKIKLISLRSMLYFRLRNLKNEIKENNSRKRNCQNKENISRKRKYKKTIT